MEILEDMLGIALAGSATRVSHVIPLEIIRVLIIVHIAAASLLVLRSSFFVPRPKKTRHVLRLNLIT